MFLPMVIGLDHWGKMAERLFCSGGQVFIIDDERRSHETAQAVLIAEANSRSLCDHP